MTNSGDPLSQVSNEFADWHLVKPDDEEPPVAIPKLSEPKNEGITKLIANLFASPLLTFSKLTEGLSFSCNFVDENLDEMSSIINNLSHEVLPVGAHANANQALSSIDLLESRLVHPNRETDITCQMAKLFEKKLPSIEIAKTFNSSQIPLAQKINLTAHKDIKIIYIDSEHGYFIGALLGKGNVKVAHLAKRILAESYLAYVELQRIDVQGFKIPNSELKTELNMISNEVEKLNLFKGDEEFLQLISVVNNKDNKVKGFFLEYCEGGNLLNFLKKNSLREGQAWDLFETLASGLVKLQAKKIIHHDLKPDNIFIKNGKFKIADFGFANKYSEEDLKFYANRTVIYAPPECNLKNGVNRQHSDNWSVGVTMYVALYDSYPPFITTSERRIRELTDQKIALCKPFNTIDDRDGIDTPLKIIRDLLRVNPSERLKASELQSRLKALRNAGVLLNPAKKESSFWSFFFD